LPATLSPLLLQSVLREEMGFQGAICSDSLLMAGVRDRFESEGEMALATLNAGVDVLLDLREPAEVVNYLVNSVKLETLNEFRVDEAYSRIVALKKQVFGRPLPALPAPIGMSPSISKEDLFAFTSQAVAMRAIESVGDRHPSPLPFSTDKQLTAVILKPFETAIEPPQQPLAAALGERFRQLRYIQLGPNADGSAYRQADEMARNAEQLLIAMIVRPAAWHAFGLLPEQKQFIQQLTRERSDVVLASLGVPYALQNYPGAAMRVCTYSDVPVSQQALAEFVSHSIG
jgi:hypothetical protein